ncbi:unnamed protein product [Mytilus edulis]|uniref:Endonuclease/exonuclease/phosphatase domain-containing protein n=1 Tax=Mytilus edulis TaxID=6550 RepID=A0A8S3RP28_MYTED|nr:unnamed protein product [Mytilus edulis]
MLALNETWLGSAIDKCVLSELLPTGYDIQHAARSDRKGGGVAIVHKTNLIIKHTVDYIVKIPEEIFLTGDLNFHLDDKLNCDTRKFEQTISDHGLIQHVVGATHIRGHTLDVIICREKSSILARVPSIEDLQICDDKGISSLDHFAVLCELNITKPPKQRKSVSFRKFKEINIENIEMDINNSLLLNEQTTSVEQVVASYDSVLRTVLDKHAPEQSKVITQRPNTEWYTDELRFAKRELRKAERQMRKTKLEVHKQIYKEHCSRTSKLLFKCKTDYYSNKISEVGHDQKKLHKLTNGLMGNTNDVVLPSHQSEFELSNRFGNVFLGKIETIRTNLCLVNESSAYENEEFNCVLFEVLKYGSSDLEA